MTAPNVPQKWEYKAVHHLEVLSNSIAAAACILKRQVV
jgi:hypothetical protein